MLKISILHGPSCLKIFSAILFWLTILLNLPLKSIKKPSKSGAEWNTVGPPPRAIWLDRSQNFIRAVLFSDYVCMCQIKLTQKILTDSSSYCFIIKKKPLWSISPSLFEHFIGSSITWGRFRTTIAWVLLLCYSCFNNIKLLWIPHLVIWSMQFFMVLFIWDLPQGSYFIVCLHISGPFKLLFHIFCFS